MSMHVNEPGNGEAYIVACLRMPADSGETARDLYVRIASVLATRKLAIVHERIFGSIAVKSRVVAARRQALGEHFGISDNIVTYIEGHPPWGEGLAGIIIRAVPAENVWMIEHQGITCGRGWQGNGCTFLMLQDINGRREGSDKQESRALQVSRMIDRAGLILGEYGASYSDVVRTWFYLSDILDWYAEFNKVRNEKYGEFGIMPGPGDGNLMLPASTGIRGNTRSGIAVVMDLFALVGVKNSLWPVKKLTNKGQLDAFRYGSAFSRGAVVREADVSLIQVSGTAAIDERGVSRHSGDIRSQINCTFEKIESLLGQEGAGLSDICAATVFVKRSQDARLFWEMAVDYGLKDFPAVCVVADVCREELLFEVDGEAVIRNE